jgi:hypothetical protein
MYHFISSQVSRISDINSRAARGHFFVLVFWVSKLRFTKSAIARDKGFEDMRRDCRGIY